MDFLAFETGDSAFLEEIFLAYQAGYSVAFIGGFFLSSDTGVSAVSSATGVFPTACAGVLLIFDIDYGVSSEIRAFLTLEFASSGVIGLKTSKLSYGVAIDMDASDSSISGEGVCLSGVGAYCTSTSSAVLGFL